DIIVSLARDFLAARGGADNTDQGLAILPAQRLELVVGQHAALAQFIASMRDCFSAGDSSRQVRPTQAILSSKGGLNGALKGRLVALNADDILRLLAADGLDNVFLAANRVDSHDAAFEHE